MISEQLAFQLIQHMERLERKLEFLNARVGKLDEVKELRREADKLQQSANALPEQHAAYLRRRATQIKEEQNVGK